MSKRALFFSVVGLSMVLLAAYSHKSAAGVTHTAKVTFDWKENMLTIDMQGTYEFKGAGQTLLMSVEHDHNGPKEFFDVYMKVEQSKLIFTPVKKGSTLDWRVCVEGIIGEFQDKGYSARPNVHMVNCPNLGHKQPDCAAGEIIFIQESRPHTTPTPTPPAKTVPHDIQTKIAEVV